MAQGKFPSPYVNTIKEDGADPMMKRIDMDTMEIGARPSVLPKDMMAEGMNIEHVGKGS